MIRAVVFDFNGLIVNDEHLHYLLFAEQLATQGIALTEELYNERYLGYDDRGCFSVALADFGKPRTSEIIHKLIADKAKRYLELARQELVFFPGVAETVRRLAERVPLAVCSGALRAEVLLGIEIAGISNYFQGVVAAEDTAECKPHPEGYLMAIALLQEREPSLVAPEIMAVEDSLAGIAAAKAAGMQVVAIPNSYPVKKLELADPTAIVADLPAFADWVLERVPK
ncbi:MAG: HAD family hydrolase [Isosphaeraceae bacterium]